MAKRPPPLAPRAPEVVAAFRHTADGVMALDPEGTILFWNEAAEHILGYTAAEVVGRPCWDVLHGRTEEGNLSCHPHCHVLAMAERHEPIRAYTLLTRAKDGTPRWINISTIQVTTPQGYILVRPFRDVTSQQHLMEALLHHVGDSKVARSPGPDPALAPLTAREREVLRALANGRGPDDIARDLGIHTATVRNHIQNILSKLGVHSRLEAVAIAFRTGLV